MKAKVTKKKSCNSIQIGNIEQYSTCTLMELNHSWRLKLRGWGARLTSYQVPTASLKLVVLTLFH